MSYALEFAPDAMSQWRELDVGLQEAVLDALEVIAAASLVPGAGFPRHCVGSVRGTALRLHSVCAGGDETERFGCSSFREAIEVAPFASTDCRHLPQRHRMTGVFRVDTGSSDSREKLFQTKR